MPLKQWAKDRLSPQAIRRLKSMELRARKAAAMGDRLLLGWWCPNDLTRLASIFGTDKWGTHWYTPHYERYLKPLKFKRINVLEIGVGGYDAVSRGGASLRMWKAFFPFGKIVGVDIVDKSIFRERRVDIRQCDQTDVAALTRLSQEYGGFDVIIDDGSHLNEHVITTFKGLFPLLKPNGVYAVEDTQTACWPTWGGGLNSPSSSITFLKQFVDGLNYMEYPDPDYQPTYFDKNIIEIAFFHNLVIIQKGANDERTNCPHLIEREIDEMNAQSARAPESTPH